MYTSRDVSLQGSVALGMGYRVFCSVVYVFLGSFVLWLSAKVQVPFYPVPMTMQTYVIFVIAALYGWRLGLMTVLLYLLEGALGLPVFAGTPEKGVGLVYMLGPTGGYLLGFVVAVFVIGFLSSVWRRTLLTATVVITLGAVVILGFGVLYLSSLIGWSAALQFGLFPFLLSEGLKVCLAVVTVWMVWRLTEKRVEKE